MKTIETTLELWGKKDLEQYKNCSELELGTLVKNKILQQLNDIEEEENKKRKYDNKCYVLFSNHQIKIIKFTFGKFRYLGKQCTAFSNIYDDGIFMDINSSDVHYQYTDINSLLTDKESFEITTEQFNDLYTKYTTKAFNAKSLSEEIKQDYNIFANK